MGCKPEWSDSTKEYNNNTQIKLLYRENEILKNAIREISRIGHPYGCTKKIADDALLDIGE